MHHGLNWLISSGFRDSLRLLLCVGLLTPAAHSLQTEAPVLSDRMVFNQALAGWLRCADGEAYIGDEYLVPGSTPLHIAVIIGNISIVHAILQASVSKNKLLFSWGGRAFAGIVGASGGCKMRIVAWLECYTRSCTSELG